MKGSGYIADFNQADGLPPLVVQKLNNNFRSVGGVTSGGSAYGYPLAPSSYNDLEDRPSIEYVELVDNRMFPDLGIFRIDDQGYDVPDDYTLSTMDINDLWSNSQPIGEQNG